MQSNGEHHNRPTPHLRSLPADGLGAMGRVDLPLWVSPATLAKVCFATRHINRNRHGEGSLCCWSKSTNLQPIFRCRHQSSIPLSAHNIVAHLLCPLAIVMRNRPSATLTKGAFVARGEAVAVVARCSICNVDSSAITCAPFTGKVGIEEWY
jgi:hypothetical protein